MTDAQKFFFDLKGWLPSVPSQYHRLNLAHEAVAAMPPKRQSLFRGVYVHDFTIKPHEEGGNRYYSRENRSL